MNSRRAPARWRTRTGRVPPGVFEIETESASRQRLTRSKSALAEGMHGLCRRTGDSRNGRVCLQASWLYGMCAGTVVLLGAVLYLIAARRGEALLRRELEARLAERERESRELNDTLVQGLQGLILRFQAVCERIPAREPARDLMERALERADRMLVDSREQVR